MWAFKRKNKKNPCTKDYIKKNKDGGVITDTKNIVVTYSCSNITCYTAKTHHERQDPNISHPHDDDKDPLEEEEQVWLTVLKHHPKNERLSLTNMAVNHNCVLSFSDLLCNKSFTMRIITIHGCSIADQDTKSLASALMKNRTLLELNLANNNIQGDGAKAIGELLKVNTPLKVIGLDGNQIGDEGTKGITMGLTTNSTLLELDLSSNAISDGGAIALGEALGHSTSALKRLILKNNQIRSNGVKGLAGGLSSNASLEILSIRGNTDIGEEGISYMVKALKTNSSLQRLDMRSSPFVSNINEEYKSPLMEAKFFNTEIKNISAGSYIPIHHWQESWDKDGKHYNWKVAALKRDALGRLPIHDAANQCIPWDEGMKDIVGSNYDALYERDSITGLYPFMLPARSTSKLCGLELSFQLLRLNPSILQSHLGF